MRGNASKDYGKGRTAMARSEVKGNLSQLGRLAALLEKQGLDVSDVGEVKQLRFNEWQGLYKDAAGTAHMVNMEGQSIVLSPSWDSGPAWPVVQQAKSVRVVNERARVVSGAHSGWKTCVFLPDPQIGYRRLPGGTLDPFHDLRAIDIALQIVEYLRPDLVVWLGDFLDLAPMGKYRQEPGFAMTVQAALDYGHELLSKVCALAPEVRLIEGNHDVRLQNYVLDNAMASFGLRQANKPADWPVMTVPYLLRLDELGVEYVGGYPSGATYVNDNLAAIHGHKVNSAGSTAAQVVNAEQVSIVMGHIHRIETQFKTRNSRGRARTILAHSPGTLARIDGAVPSVRSGLDPKGHPVRQYENWQQGLSVAAYEEGNGRFALESVAIFTENGTDAWAMHRGRVYTSRVSTQGEVL